MFSHLQNKVGNTCHEQLTDTISSAYIIILLSAISKWTVRHVMLPSQTHFLKKMTNSTLGFRGFSEVLQEQVAKQVVKTVRNLHLNQKPCKWSLLHPNKISNGISPLVPLPPSLLVYPVTSLFSGFSKYIPVPHPPLKKRWIIPLVPWGCHIRGIQGA